MPHLLTVAGDATARSPTSNIMDMVADIAMISLLGRHNFLLSSNTVQRQRQVQGHRWRVSQTCHARNVFNNSHNHTNRHKLSNYGIPVCLTKPLIRCQSHNALPEPIQGCIQQLSDRQEACVHLCSCSQSACIPVFMFSIQIASTGPSSTSHFLSGEGSAARFLNATASTPSRHSCVALSDSPAGKGNTATIRHKAERQPHCRQNQAGGRQPQDAMVHQTQSSSHMKGMFCHPLLHKATLHSLPAKSCVLEGISSLAAVQLRTHRTAGPL